MTLRDDLQPVIDNGRQLVTDLGLRPYTVATRLRVWSGAKIGIGNDVDPNYVDTDADISPTAKVSYPTPNYTYASPGKFEDGDIFVSRISREYTEEELTGGTLAANEEWMWVIDGKHYRLVGKPEKRNFEWRVHLRRMVD